VNVHSLQQIMLAIVQAQPLEPILRKIVEGVAEDDSVALARLWLLERDEKCPICASNADLVRGQSALHLLASAGKSGFGLEKNSSIIGKSHRIEVGSRKIGRVAETMQPLLIQNVTPEQDWVSDPEWISREQIRTFAGHPLLCRGQLLGVLALFSRNDLTEEEFALLRTFADHAAVAIWNARAFAELDDLRRKLELENEYLVEEIKTEARFGEIIGNSKPLEKVLQQVELVAGTETTVLILGESGTGKEMIARAIHERSARRNRPLIKVNCGAIPEPLFESEFFGHVRGAFTGAIKDRLGRFELADNGDLFLDEIGEIPLSLQAKLLRVLQEKQFERVGDTRTRTVDVRVIAATNRDLKKEVQRGRFREDLFYRLTVFPLEVPPLRERKEDIPALAFHFIEKNAKRLNFSLPRLTRDQIRQLQSYAWPGNVRELENVLERAAIISKGSGRLHFEFPFARHRDTGLTSSAEPLAVLTKQEIKKQEAENILAALKRANGKVSGPGGAAELLGMRPTTLASRMKALGLKKHFLTSEQPAS
jgi:transcriptional regulator with GAF, ATPase, and Fis domain